MPPCRRNRLVLPARLRVCVGPPRLPAPRLPRALLAASERLGFALLIPGALPPAGGFVPGKVSVASLLTSGVKSEGGKTYYEYEVLTRTADGDEGGRHHVFKATVSNGKLYILKLQAGDKRWFKGVEREAKKSAASFQVV